MVKGSLPPLPSAPSPITLLALVSQPISQFSHDGGVQSLASDLEALRLTGTAVPGQILSCLLHLLNQIKLLPWPLYISFTVICTFLIFQICINEIISYDKHAVVIPESTKGLPFSNFFLLAGTQFTP